MALIQPTEGQVRGSPDNLLTSEVRPQQTSAVASEHGLGFESPSTRGAKMLRTSLVLISTLFPLMCMGASNLPIQLAHEKGFKGCDGAIAKAFKHADGSVRVSVANFDESRADSIRITATFGNRGDSHYLDAQFRKLAGRCLWMQTIVITSEKSCLTFKEEQARSFSFVEESSDYTWTKNPGGVSLLLKSVGSGCMGIYLVDQID